MQVLEFRPRRRVLALAVSLAAQLHALLCPTRAAPTCPTRLASLPLAAKLIGADMKVSVNGAGAHFRSVDSNQDAGSAIAVGGARPVGGAQTRPDPNGPTWEITLESPVEDDYSGSFTAACQINARVTILAVTGLDPDELAAAGPWYVSSKRLRGAMGEAMIENLTIKATYKGMRAGTTAPSYPDPDTLT